MCMTSGVVCSILTMRIQTIIFSLHTHITWLKLNVLSIFLFTFKIIVYEEPYLVSFSLIFREMLHIIRPQSVWGINHVKNKQFHTYASQSFMVVVNPFSMRKFLCVLSIYYGRALAVLQECHPVLFLPTLYHATSSPRCVCFGYFDLIATSS